MATRPRNKDHLSLQVRKIETELLALTEKSKEPVITSKVPASTVPNTRYEVELTQYAFDQSDKFVKLFITLDGVEKCPEENVVTDFTDNSLLLKVKDLNNRDYRLQINNLLEPIDATKSYRKIKTGMVVVYAKKSAEGIRAHRFNLRIVTSCL